MKSTTAARMDIVRRINKKLAPDLHFLVAKRRAGQFVGYCLVGGDPSRPTTWIVEGTPVDLVDTALRYGVHLSSGDIACITDTKVAA